MSFFTNPQNYPYRSGGLFLGVDENGLEVGITTERHAITIAGAGAGKGACLLIPNALRWPHNLLVVDPKGEVAAASWQAREAMGQAVHVLDPFKVADVPDRLRASFNPLSAIDPESPTGREDIEAIADGLIKRSDPKHEEWYDGAASLLAGLMAYAIERAPPESRNLAGVRELLNQEDDALNIDAQMMLDAKAFGRLARDAGLTILTALKSEKGMEKDFLGAAKRYTKWMDSPPIAAALATSSFNLTDLKTGAASVFLVLPPQYIDTHAAFLRMFVRGGITAMMEDGAKVKKRCLFMMDEFYTLGKLDIVAKSAGLMRGYGLHLWPFLQDLGQLQTLYGEKLSETFFGNADAHIFFGNTDSITLNYVSNQLGEFETGEVNAPPPKQAFTPSFWSNHKSLDGELTGDGKLAKDEWEAAQETHNRQHQYAMSRVGKNRVPADKVRSIVAKKNGDAVAQSMIVIAKGSDILNLRLDPYFLKKAEPAQQSALKAKPVKRKYAWHWAWVLGGMTFAAIILLKNWEEIQHRDGSPIMAIIMFGVFGGIIGEGVERIKRQFERIKRRYGSS
jgi:hypothetical protein